jgi:hypothetical protein
LFWGRRTEADTFDWWLARNLSDLTATGAESVIAKLGFTGQGSVYIGDWIPRAWTGAGVWFSGRLGGAINLWTVPVSLSTGRVAGRPQRVTSGANDNFSPAVDRTGRVVFQQAETTSASLLLPMDVNAGKPAGPVKTLRRDFSLDAGRHSMSDDGRWITYVRHRVNVTHIVIVDLQNGEERELTSFPFRGANAIISRDGAYVAWSADPLSPAAGYVVSASGGVVRKLCDGCALYGWLADNRSILSVENNQQVLRVRNVETGAAREALRTTNLTRPHLSWDDKWLAFRTSGRVWVAPFRPGSPPPPSEWSSAARIIESERHCGWSPDGRLLYMLLGKDGFRCLYAQPVDRGTGKPQGVPFAVQHFHNPRWEYVSTPFGNGIIRSGFVFSVPETTGGIWLMEP